MRAITDIVTPTRGQMSSINNWIAGRVELRTTYAMGQGKQRFYSYDNVLELAFVVALIKAGLKASSAVAYAAEFRKLAWQDALPRFFAFANGDPKVGKMDDIDSLRQWQHWFPEAAAICIVPVEEIKQRVDAYFTAHSVEV